MCSDFNPSMTALASTSAPRAGVNNHDPFLHLCYAFRIDQMECLRRQRTMKADNVRLSEQRVQVDILAAEISKFAVLIGIIAEKVDPKTCKKA